MFSLYEVHDVMMTQSLKSNITPNLSLTKKKVIKLALLFIVTEKRKKIIQKCNFFNFYPVI